MSYLLIVIITISGVTTSYIKVTPDALACVAEADAAKQKMSGTQAQWTLRTKCVPVTDVRAA